MNICQPRGIFLFFSILDNEERIQNKESTDRNNTFTELPDR